MPLNEYGKITGSIVSISADSFVNDANPRKFYKAEAIVDKTKLKNVKGEVREIKAGMITDARVISSSKKIIVWLFQKINLMD
ncbi:hypothetical protein RBG61_01605 [Paludicola sp. MB14-C6]|uniref:hypothetical protein n=1 Tax=Paludihabitans sp. MB14-C6 TaxID=3070656 RepID=UPI0027DDD3B3|nr:hypothetical protein [Paludicola sp. MB14-C6]WMJ23386.1 hypothetical protein RBG61_01605 [Paludicola sp. MB14-C6]